MSEIFSGVINNLKGTFVKHIIHLDEVDSTNNYLQQLAVEGYPNGTVVIADKQHRGRGRHSNQWFSPKGNIYMSVLIKPVDLDLDVLSIVPAFTYIGAISCVKAINDFCLFKTTIKWPNDIVYMDKKLGGILTETRIVGKEVIYVIVGIGLNINTKIEEFPEELKPNTTSLFGIHGKKTEIHVMVSNILSRFDDFYNLLKLHGLSPIISEWIKCNSTLNRSVIVTQGNKKYEGIAQGLDDIGRLLIKDTDGRITPITNGHLSFS